MWKTTFKKLIKIKRLLEVARTISAGRLSIFLKPNLFVKVSQRFEVHDKMTKTKDSHFQTSLSRTDRSLIQGAVVKYGTLIPVL